MQAKDVMTSPVVSVEPDATILQAIRTMLQRRISGLPVIDKDGHLIGIVTEGDFLRRVETGTERRRPRWLEFLIGPGRLADEYTRSHGRKVNEVMTPDPTTVTEDAPLDEIVKLMERRQFKRIPVVRGEQVVGIVTRANLVHAIASAFPEAQAVELNRRCGHSCAAYGRAGKTGLGAGGSHQPDRKKWGCRNMGHDNGRPGASGDQGRGREYPGRQSGARSPGLGRSHFRYGDRSVGGRIG